MKRSSKVVVLMVVFIVFLVLSQAIEAKEAKPRGLLLGAGLNGGAATFRTGYVFPNKWRNNIGLGVVLGFGAGRSYSLTLIQGEISFRINPQFFWCADLDFVNYSEKARSIPGLSGTAEKGGLTGVGAALGRDFGVWSAKLGYSTVLGITFNVGRVF